MPDAPANNGSAFDRLLRGEITSAEYVADIKRRTRREVNEMGPPRRIHWRWKLKAVWWGFTHPFARKAQRWEAARRLVDEWVEAGRP